MAARIVVVAADNSKAHAYANLEGLRSVGFSAPKKKWPKVVFFDGNGKRLKPAFEGVNLVGLSPQVVNIGYSLKWRLNRVLRKTAARTGEQPTALPIDDLAELLGIFGHGSGEAGATNAGSRWHRLLRHRWF